MPLNHFLSASTLFHKSYLCIIRRESSAIKWWMCKTFSKYFFKIYYNIINVFLSKKSAQFINKERVYLS